MFFFKKSLNNKLDLRNLIYKNFKNLTKEEFKEFCDNFNNKYDYSKIKDMSYLFNETGFKEITYLPLIYMENVENAKSMFAGCENLEEIKLKNNNENYEGFTKLLDI